MPTPSFVSVETPARQDDAVTDINNGRRSYAIEEEENTPVLPDTRYQEHDKRRVHGFFSSAFHL